MGKEPKHIYGENESWHKIGDSWYSTKYQSGGLTTLEKIVYGGCGIVMTVCAGIGMYCVGDWFWGIVIVGILSAITYCLITG
jgi:hypothetical protein